MGTRGREAIGILVRNYCTGQNTDHINRWLNVTNGAPQNWISAALADDGRSPAWLAKHGKTTDYWSGEVDYLGPCQGGRDADCDHWYDEHDYCPYRFDPWQLENDPENANCRKPPPQQEVNGASRAPAPYQSRFDQSTPIGEVCPPDGNCRVGFCYWRTIHGPFWQSTTGGTGFDSSLRSGTGIAILAREGQWVVRNQGDKTIVPAGSPIPPSFGAGGTAECLGFDELPVGDIPDPNACVLEKLTIRDPMGTLGTGQSPFTVGGGAAVLPALTGFLGNVAQRYAYIPPPGGPARIDPDVTALQHTSTSASLRWYLSEINLSGSFYYSGGSQREAFGFSCGASSVRYKVTNTQSRGDVLLLGRAAAENARCFITAIEGAWHATRNNGAIQPFAEIYTAENGDVRLRVGATNLLSTGVDDRVSARASCIELKSSAPRPTQ